MRLKNIQEFFREHIRGSPFVNNIGATVYTALDKKHPLIVCDVSLTIKNNEKETEKYKKIVNDLTALFTLQEVEFKVNTYSDVEVLASRFTIPILDFMKDATFDDVIEFVIESTSLLFAMSSGFGECRVQRIAPDKGDEITIHEVAKMIAKNSTKIKLAEEL